MLVLVWIVPRDDREILPDVDFQQVADHAQPGYEQTLTNPDVPSSWQANQAEIRTGQDGVVEWYVGFLVLGDDRAQEFVGMSQGLGANDTWTYEKVDRSSPTGSIMIDGVEWDEYDYRDLDPDDAGNTLYSLVHVDDDATHVLYGSHSAESVQELAARIF
ncbi:hypothetical protein GCM10022261_27160 [Brevibacterium daeguense]|uniref:DUF4245 domain-containing protein n=1 Tax=Brevibacterium daeguense TaxID=909936 RepID=A0ABP8EMG5_9MICO